MSKITNATCDEEFSGEDVIDTKKVSRRGSKNEITAI